MNRGLCPGTPNICHGGGYVEKLTADRKMRQWRAETMMRYLGMCEAILPCTPAPKVGWNPTSISEGGEGFVAGEV